MTQAPTATRHRRPLIAGNWKMYKTREEGLHFLEALASAAVSGQWPAAEFLPELALFVPFTLLEALHKKASELKAPLSVAIGAQNMESRVEGALTGEISPRMLEDVGVSWVLIGHSERRQYYNETDATVNAKLLAAYAHEMQPILCVGETLAQREAGGTDALVAEQTQKATQGLSPEQALSLVIAYEPVWAIGTGKVCDADEANRVCGVIRQQLASLYDESLAAQVRILYGGSVKPDNSAELLAQPEIDGALIGGASLDPASYLTIVQATSAKPATLNACSL
ncbi:MAG: triose-phosphate isomerase [Candidatus Melainabacteria bacterium]|nr:triose-phosphate isomerase [Candidatus Melainabacteria bacterium]